MKRLIPALIILAITIGIFIGSYYYVNATCKEATKLIDECIDEYKENGTTINKAKEFKDYWDKKEKTLSIFVNHIAIDEIEVSVAELSYHSNFKDNTMFYDSAIRIKTLIHQIFEDTKVTAHSIF